MLFLRKTTKIDYQEWSNHARLEFNDQAFDEVNLDNCKATPNPDNYDFNTELIFKSCKIAYINATTLQIGKKITLVNCKIGGFCFYATYFYRGFEMRNCEVKEASTFDCGVHNLDPHEFIIDNCSFEGYLDFFDIYFSGPVRITNNKFKQATNIGIYLGVPYGIDEGVSYVLENNQGRLDKYADNDPFNPANQK